MGAFPLRSIAVICSSACGWLAAATLARVLGASCAVRVLEVGDDGGAFVSVPSLHRLWRLLGIDEATLLRGTATSYRLGSDFRNWGAPGQRYFHGFGAIGHPLGAVPFHHHWLRATSHGDTSMLEDFSLAAQAARLERFAPPEPDPRSLLSRYAYAWHFDGRELGRLLRELAVKLGVTARAGEVTRVAHEGGQVRELCLADGSTVAADFFVDASGARELLRKALAIPLEDWSSWLPCDRSLAARVEDGSPAPFSVCTAVTNGWQLRVPLRQDAELAYVYDGELEDDEAALARWREFAGGKSEPRSTRLIRGRPRQFWVGNVVLLPGETLDPLEGTALHLAQSGITRLLAHFPVARDDPHDAAEYNRLAAEEYDRLRDLLVLHYHATRREDSALWRRCRAATPPPELAQRLELFADSGRISIGEEEHCGIDGWLSALLGQGVMPRSYDPLADSLPLDTVRTALGNFAAQVRAAAATLPLHSDYLLQRMASPAGARP